MHRTLRGQPTKFSGNPNALRATLDIQEIEQTTRFSEAEVLTWSEPRMRARLNAIIRTQLTLVGGDVLPSNIPVKIPMLWLIARLLGTAVGFDTGEVAKYIEGQPTRISRHPNALRATLNIQKIEQTIRFSGAEEPRLRAKRNAMIRTRSTLVGGDALPSNIPAKIPML